MAPVSLQRLAHLRQVLQTIPAGARRLELLASAHFLLRTRQAKSSDVAGLRAVLLRNEKDFSEPDIRQALEDLKQHELFPPGEPR
jgi:hypothetical protein